MSVPRYERMRPFAWAWISEIPEHWTTPPLSARYVFDLGKMLDEKRETGRYATPYLRNVNVQWDTFNLESVHTMDIAPHEEARYLLRPGDVLICEGGEVGRAATWNGEIERCAYQKALHRARPIGYEDSRFLYYSLRACFDQGVFEAGGNPNTILHLTGEQLRAYRLPCPPADEQREIAVFLDRETAEIDVLIREQERLIALLEEKRQAVILHAVTKGLDPLARRHSSGVSWVGDIPSHWTVQRLGAICDFQNGAAFAPSDWSETGLPIIRIQNLNGGEDFNFFSGTPDPRMVIESGDLLFGWSGNRGTSFGPFLWQRPGRFVLNQHIFKVLSQRLASRHLYWILRGVTAEIEQAAHGMIGMVHITKAKLLATPVAVPPANELAEIVSYLESATTSLDEAMASARVAQELLRERRSALITAAVTGQIDVRSLVSAA